MVDHALPAGIVPVAHRTPATARWRSDRTAVTVAALLAAALYVTHPPAVPDLAAQVARVEASRAGGFLWWSGWFGGLQLPAYSALSPLIMARIGVSVAAAGAALAMTGFGFVLLRHSRRPIAGTAILSAAGFADILAGRVTFALGATAAVAALILIRHASLAPAAAVACLTFLLSPLAGLFLGLVALGIAAADPPRRRPAVAVAVVLIGAGAVQAVMFPGAGQMPYPWWHLALALLSVGLVATVCPDRTVRAGCVVVAAAALFFFVIPSPVGTNVVRLVWFAATPTVAATACLRRRGLLLAAVALAVWPTADLGVQLHRAASPASQSAFFSPLVSAWRQQVARQGGTTKGERLELVEPASQWGAAYVAPFVPIARGWDRPTDRADNALFYNGRLTPTTYRSWLASMSVGWVALPLHVSLDYASVREAALVQQQPSYLRPLWRNGSWELFRVVGAQPLITGATWVQTNGRGVTFRVNSPGPVDLDVRWSPYLRLNAGQGTVAACVLDRKPWTQVLVPRRGTYTLSAHFDPGSGASSCPSG